MKYTIRNIHQVIVFFSKCLKGNVSFLIKLGIILQIVIFAVLLIQITKFETEKPDEHVNDILIIEKSASVEIRADSLNTNVESGIPVREGSKGDTNKESVQVLNIERNDFNCKNRQVLLSEKPLPPIGLVSFPGSGSTWIRHLIQQMTGLGTASVYCDGGLRNRGFPFECHNGHQVVVTKTHLFNNEKISQYNKLLLLIRNPYDAILSYLNFAKAGHTGHATKEQLLEIKPKLLDVSLSWYKNNVKAVTNFTGPVYVLQYEAIKQDIVNELRKLAEYLNVNVTENDINCTVKLQEGTYHRNTSETWHVQLLKAVYEERDFARLKAVADEVETILKERFKKVVDLNGPLQNII